mgnify:CR=1 FL=1
MYGWSDAERLTLQLRFLEIDAPLVEIIIRDHWDEFMQRKFVSLAKTLGIAFNNQAQIGGHRRGTKFDYVVAQGLVSQDEVHQAIGIARQRGIDVETVLLEQFKVPKGELGQSLSQFYHVPFVEYDSKVIPPPDLMKDLKLEFLKRNLWLPVRRDGDAILVLIDNPSHHAGGDFALDNGRVALDGPQRYTFSGIGVYHPSLFAGIPAGAKYQLAAVLKPNIAAGRVTGEHFAGRWCDVGTPDRLKALDRALRG